MTNKPTAFEEVRELKKLGIYPLEFAFMVQDIKKMLASIDGALERNDGKSMSEYVTFIKEVHQALFKK